MKIKIYKADKFRDNSLIEDPPNEIETWFDLQKFDLPRTYGEHTYWAKEGMPIVTTPGFEF